MVEFGVNMVWWFDFKHVAHEPEGPGIVKAVQQEEASAEYADRSY